MSAFLFFLNSAALGVGLAMDAFSVSIANGLNEPHMSRRKTWMIAGCYAWFQFMMPVLGWFCVHQVAGYFKAFQPFIPWIALLLLLYIGGKMLIQGLRQAGSKRERDEEQRAASYEKATGKKPNTALGPGELLLQGIATSIDALSVGFTIAKYDAAAAIGSSLIIAAVTLVICLVGLVFGKRFGEKLADKATVLGGLILIAIGIEIFVTGVC